MAEAPPLLRALRRWLAALLLGALAAPAAAPAPPPAVLVLGDSLSAGHGLEGAPAWPALLEERLERHGYPHRVVNASRSGETAAGGARRLPGLLERHAPRAVLLQLGGNDGLRGQAPERVEADLEAMIEASREAGARVVLLGIRLPANYGPHYTERFEAIYPRLAEAHELPFVPFLLEGLWDREAMMQDDGIHPTARAQPRIAERVWERLRGVLERRREEAAEAG
ncbi:arylesterase [Halorhodospira neutriphila]|uniref:Arylesterase n=1 Tax=Halorhodospira neutriphila TaxID=168379 RepID=A0ABS1EA54_9GAMM|nr:arylesterase [Halorhodospira neutriphila]MBK1727166.1 arylesterase [Halorhodospira neutriphila]